MWQVLGLRRRRRNELSHALLHACLDITSWEAAVPATSVELSHQIMMPC